MIANPWTSSSYVNLSRALLVVFKLLLSHYFTVEVFQIQNEMKQKWKCSICNKVLSSKQIVENHIIKLHPDSDKSVKQYIQVQVTSEEKQSKKPKKVKAKSAYASFSGLFNIFANKDLCKDFSLYPQANQKDKNKQQQPPINQTADMQGVIEARNDSTIGSGELVLTEAIGVTMPKDDSTMGPHESGDDNVMVGDKQK